MDARVSLRHLFVKVRNYHLTYYKNKAMGANKKLKVQSKPDMYKGNIRVPFEYVKNLHLSKYQKNLKKLNQQR
jgi:hypothetical protein